MHLFVEKGLDVAVAAYVARAPVPFLTIGGLDGWSAVTQSVPLDSTHAELRLDRWKSSCDGTGSGADMGAESYF